MKEIILMIIICILVVLLEGCVMLTVGLNEDGFNIGLTGDFPEVPTFNYEKELISE
jgi:hypothetical protein